MAYADRGKEVVKMNMRKISYLGILERENSYPFIRGEYEQEEQESYYLGKAFGY